MAVLRDYGNFSKAAARLLKPMIEPLGYRQIKGAAFGRQRDGWIEGFFLQQSAWGGGHFYVNVGLNVPALDDFWQTEEVDRSFGLMLGARLGGRGVEHGAESYPAENKVELTSSLESVVGNLTFADTWFAKFRTIKDVATKYKVHSGGAIGNINYGCLLLLAGQASEAKKKLEIALRQCQKIVKEENPYLQRKKPGKEALSFYALDVHRLKVVEAALSRLS
jgi:Domain of unknown function (DUF4304)